MRNWQGRTYHCTADEAGVDYPLSYYDEMHRKRGMRKVAYHFIVHLDGEIDIGRTLDEIGAHARGYNSKYIGIAYVGGLEAGSVTEERPNGKPQDTRTVAQIHALRALDKVLTSMGVGEERMGHRDLSVDLNEDGVITKNEWMKSCPCFDAKTDF